MYVSYVSESAAMLLTPRQCAAMVSITEPGREAPLPWPEVWGALLRVQFADAEYDGQMIARVEARGKAFDAEVKGFPCRRTAEAIRAFLARLESDPKITELVVHCHAGQRRSAAVAKFASEMFGARFDHGHEGYNQTVYSLLKDPAQYERPRPRGRLLGFLRFLSGKRY